MIYYVSNNATKSLKGIRITDSTGVANCYIDADYKHLHYTKDNKDFFLINNMDMKGGDDPQYAIDGLVIGNNLCCKEFNNQITQLFEIYVSIDSATYNSSRAVPYQGTFYDHNIKYDVVMRVNGYGQIVNFSPKINVNSRIAGGANGATVSKTLSKYSVSETYRNNITFSWSTRSSISSKPDLRPTDFALQIGGTWVSLDRLSGGWNSGLNTNGGYYIFGLAANSSKWGVEVDS